MASDTITTFRPVKVRGHLSQKKSCTLEACAALHPLGQSNLLVCKGCKIAAYCSRSCQKMDWRNHKPLCNTQRQTPTYATDIVTSMGQTAEELTRLLYDFQSLHSTSIASLVYGHIFHTTSARSFPYTSQCMAFQLSYRMDCGGNPALAFRVENAGILLRSALGRKDRDAIESGKSAADAMKVRRQAAHSDFVDILPVLFTFGTQRVIEQLAIYDRPSPIRFDLMGPGFFLNQLKVLAERGHVYRDVGVGDLIIGQMKKRGRKWCWVALTDEEAGAGGYANRPESVEGFIVQDNF